MVAYAELPLEAVARLPFYRFVRLKDIKGLFGIQVKYRCSRKEVNLYGVDGTLYV